MGAKSKIEWTDATWNPLRGCTRVSEGCRNCYAERVAGRFSGKGQPYEGLASMKGGQPRWTGNVRLIKERLEDPLRWKKPRRIFVNSMSDLFHRSVHQVWIDRLFAVMALCPEHTFQILTKRPDRMFAYFSRHVGIDLGAGGVEWQSLSRQSVSHQMQEIVLSLKGRAGRRKWGIPPPWPLPNVWLGVSVEDQKTADQRIPLLLETPAVVRFVSYEPALNAVSLMRCLPPAPEMFGLRGLDWVIAGGESGPGARPAHPDWFRTVRDECQAACVPFFFKQWGNNLVLRSGFGWENMPKRAGGRLLDGREWNEFPEGRR